VLASGSARHRSPRRVLPTRNPTPRAHHHQMASPDRCMAPSQVHQRTHRGREQSDQEGQTRHVRDHELDQLPHPITALRREAELGPPPGPQPTLKSEAPHIVHTSYGRDASPAATEPRSNPCGGHFESSVADFGAACTESDDDPAVPTDTGRKRVITVIRTSGSIDTRCCCRLVRSSSNVLFDGPASSASGGTSEG